MYIDLKVGKRGEVVIPAFLRKRLKLRGKLKLNVAGTKIELVAGGRDIIADFEDIARKEGLPARKIVYGDKLYEGVFR